MDQREQRSGLKPYAALTLTWKRWISQRTNSCPWIRLIKGFDIFAEEAKHSVTALAYRIETEEKVVVYSGDTEPVYARGCACSEC